MKPEYFTVLPPTKDDLDAARGVLLGLAISVVLCLIGLFTVVVWK